MENLIQKANIKEKELKNFIYKYVATEISQLASPCHKSTFEKASQEILKLINLTENDMKQFSSKFYRPLGDKSEFLILKDTGTSTLLFLISYFLKKNDIETYYYLNIFLTIKFYISMYNRSFKSFCNPGLFDLTLQHLSQNHMYSQKHGIPGALLYLSNTMADKHKDILKSFDNPELISKYVYELMNRVKQSFKSFFDMYKTLLDKGEKGFKPAKETEEGEEYATQSEMIYGDRIMHKVVEHMLTYKQLDNIAFNKAVKISNFNDKEFLMIITKDLADLKYEKQIKNITKIFISKLTSPTEVCGKKFVDYILKLLSAKRSTSFTYQKELVILFNEIVYHNAKLKTYHDLSRQNKYKVLKFFSFYISLYIKSIICGNK